MTWVKGLSLCSMLTGLCSDTVALFLDVNVNVCFYFFYVQMKKELSDNESITQEVVGNAHIENYALKMFLYADNEDRAGRFHK